MRWLGIALGIGWLALASTTVADPRSPAPATAPKSATPTFGEGQVLRAALRAELARSLAELSLPDLPKPYFISALVSRQASVGVTATLGQVVSQIELHSRVLSVDVRVGDYEFDNGNFMGDGPAGAAETIGQEDDVMALRRATWRLADQAYKGATSNYEGKRAQRRSEAEQESRPPSFARARPEQSIALQTAPVPSAAHSAGLAEELSAVFLEFDEIQDSGVFIVAGVGQRSFVSTEGAEIVQPTALTGVVVWATTQAPDGMQLSNHVSYLVRDATSLPARAELLVAARAVATELSALAQAPVIEEYSGPVLFEGVAAAQLVQHLLGEQLSGTPPPETPGGLMEGERKVVGRVGWPVLPRGFSLIDDPTLQAHAGLPLAGGHAFDDEGVAARRTEVVKDGKLVALLTSRTPSEEFRESNGHARHGYLGAPAGAPSNLILQPRRGVTRLALRARLLREVEREGLPFGIIVRRLEDPGASVLATAQRGDARAPVGPGELPRPILVVRVNLDGTEQLLRGARLDALHTRDLRDILAATRTAEAHGFGIRALSGALSPDLGGETALGVVSPDLLLRRADLRQTTGPHPRLPVLSRPPVSAKR